MDTPKPTVSAFKMLIVGSGNAPADLRAEFLRGHGLLVDVAASITDARSLWGPSTYRWVLVDVRKHLPSEVSGFCEELRKANPDQKIAFWVGPPRFLVFTWPEALSIKASTSPEQEEWVAKLASAA